MIFQRICQANSGCGATLPGNLLYPLARTGPVVPAHPGDDQERGQAEREFLEDALCPAWPVAMLLRARGF